MPIDQLALDIIVELFEWKRRSFTASLEYLTAYKRSISHALRTTVAVVFGRGDLSRVLVLHVLVVVVTGVVDRLLIHGLKPERENMLAQWLHVVTLTRHRCFARRECICRSRVGRFEQVPQYVSDDGLIANLHSL